MESQIKESSKHLSDFQLNFDHLLIASVPSLGNKSELRDACEYALRNGGKRFRPLLVKLMADALGSKAPISQAMLAVEYFHTASLIADDLPCMDNDDERRSKPSLHKAFDETTALLASYALISAGYGCLAQCSRDLAASDLPYADRSDAIGILALENVTFNTGLFGATGGQYIDIFPPELTLDVVTDVIKKKTVSLFEISFVLGWVFGGGAFEKLDKVKALAYHFGMAFQIADDIGDQQQDLINGRTINVANIAGLEAAKMLFLKELESYKNELSTFGFDDKALLGLADNLERKMASHLHEK